MESKRKLTFFLLIIAFILHNNSYSQVMIGSNEKPVSGALLQLKEEGTFANGANSTRGLGIPRVKLKGYTGDLATTMGATPGSYDAASHKGMIVYATEKYSVFPLRCSGLAVWDGEEWQTLGGPTETPDITMTDADGNTYNAKYYSVEPCDPNSAGAYWTTSNLYTTQKGAGGIFESNATALTRKNDVRLNPALSGSSVAGFETIPIAVGGLSDTETVSYGESTTVITTLNHTVSQREFARKFGLLYTYKQAMEACPPGWHLPTEQDWANLDIILGGHHNSSKVMRGNSNWYKSVHLAALVWCNTNPALVNISGFNGIPAGAAARDGKWGKEFGELATWRTATSTAVRSLGHPGYFNDYLLNPLGHLPETYYSVRCAKYK